MNFYFKLPSATSLKKFLVYFFFFANLGVATYAWLLNSNYYIFTPGPGNLLIALGRVAGVWAELFILAELVLVGRIYWVEHLFGFDKLNRVHRWIGYSILSLLLGHPLLLIWGYIQQNGYGGFMSQFIPQLQDFLANKAYVIYSFIGVIIFIYIVFLAVFARKRINYEVWYYTHLFTYLAIGFALPHQFASGDFTSDWPMWYWYILNYSVFGIYLFWRAVRPLVRFAYYRFQITNVIQETPDTISIYVTGKHMEKFRFHAGQYANITILARELWYTHPFSFSSAYNGQFIRFTIKNSGDYTARIPSVKPGTHVILDGPLGLFIEERAIRDKFLFIAGGIGITPLRSMMESLGQKQKDIVLIHAVRTEKDMAFKTEIDQIKQIDPLVKVIYILGTPVEGYESGRLDKEKVVRLVPDFFDREVFLCGPPPMMAAVVKMLKELGFGSQHIHFENFSF
jgi:predicted ferric reductase